MPGLDDGPATLEDSLAMARSAVADGIRVLAATPHVRDDYPTSPGRMESAVESIGDTELASWLTQEVPASLLSSAPLPERPAFGSRRA